eukprot:15481531-Alexandrium_andersonii.AAC.1
MPCGGKKDGELAGDKLGQQVGNLSLGFLVRHVRRRDEANGTFLVCDVAVVGHGRAPTPYILFRVVVDLCALYVEVDRNAPSHQRRTADHPCAAWVRLAPW